MRLIPDKMAASWVAEQGGVASSDFGPFRAAAVYGSDGSFRGGVVFHDWRPKCKSVEISAAAAGPWIDRRLLQAIGDYAFGVLGCVRMTARTRWNNHAAVSLLLRLGFKEEGRIRRGWNGVDDVLIFGLLPEESAPWYSRKLTEVEDGRRQA